MSSKKNTPKRTLKRDEGTLQAADDAPPGTKLRSWLQSPEYLARRGPQILYDIPTTYILNALQNDPLLCAVSFLCGLASAGFIWKWGNNNAFFFGSMIG